MKYTRFLGAYHIQATKIQKMFQLMGIILHFSATLVAFALLAALVAVYFGYGEHACGRYFEAYILAFEGHAVYLVGVVLVLWTWVECQHSGKCFEAIGVEVCLQVLREVYGELLPVTLVHKSATCIGVAVCIGHVGFDVLDRGSMHEVGTQHVDYRPFGGA